MSISDQKVAEMIVIRRGIQGDGQKDEVGAISSPVIDRVICSLAIAAAAALVKLTSPGPALYTQRRVGLNGRIFTIYKLRSMKHNCEAGTGALWSTGRRDNRVTPIGRILRKTHVDELPQLVNVLRGEMALIGPRPERPELTSDLALSINRYEHRTRVLPGLTGLAQVQLPPDTDYNSVRMKLACDLYYIENAGLALDLRIFFGTVFHVVGLPFAVFGTLLGIPSLDAILAKNGAPPTATSRRGESAEEMVTRIQPT